MKVEEHPEYPEESNRLEETKAAIRHVVETIDPSKAHGVDEWATFNLERFFSEKRERIRQVEDDPYFGRVDFSQDDDRLEKIYIGFQGLDLEQWRVLDWRAPICKLFYGSTAENQSYMAPEGGIYGKLLLKRHYKIVRGGLIDIADEVDRRTGRPDGGKMTSSDAYLLQFLYSRGDPRLQDIVKTIQEQQDRIIRASYDRILIINGVAGSGKTSIAYHRLAYLLYPDTHTKIQAYRTIVFGPNRLFISYVGDLLPRLGVKNVNQVTFDDWAMDKMQLAVKREGKYQRKFTLQEASLNTFLDHRSSRQSRIAHWKRARIKGGMKIEKLLERFVDLRKNSIQIPKDGVIYTNLGSIDLTLSISESEIRAVYAKTLSQVLPFDKLRERLISELTNSLETNRYLFSVDSGPTGLLDKGQLTDEVRNEFQNQGKPLTTAAKVEVQRSGKEWKIDDVGMWYLIRNEAQTLNVYVDRYDEAVKAEYDKQQQTVDDLRKMAIKAKDGKMLKDADGLQETAYQYRKRAKVPEIRRRILGEATALIREDIEKFWPIIQLRDDYYGLLANTGLLNQLGKDLFTDEEIALLSSLIPDYNSIDLEDIPALFYLFILSRGKSDENYDHIVIDEAQDFSPVQFHLVRMYNRNGSMTICGDIAQGIYAHRGISDWNEVKPAFQNDVLQFEEITQNYRSTREIVLFTNEILRKLRKDQALLSEPFSRSGEKPRLVEARDKQAMLAAIAKDIEGLLSKQISHIGVIAKNSIECDEATKYLQRNGIGVTNMISSRDTEYSYQGGIAVLPVALAKGIEFQAALVLNANEITYDGNIEYDGRLLYVASTRALHQLILYSVGPFSSFLEMARHKAILMKV